MGLVRDSGILTREDLVRRPRIHRSKRSPAQGPELGRREVSESLRLEALTESLS